MTWKVFIGLAIGAVIGYGLSLVSLRAGST
jgi:hypothetical protein